MRANDSLIVVRHQGRPLAFEQNTYQRAGGALKDPGIRATYDAPRQSIRVAEAVRSAVEPPFIGCLRYDTLQGTQPKAIARAKVARV